MEQSKKEPEPLFVSFKMGPDCEYRLKAVDNKTFSESASVFRSLYPNIETESSRNVSNEQWVSSLIKSSNQLTKGEPDQLSLIIDEDIRIVRRKDKYILFPKTGKNWKLFQMIYKAGNEGIKPEVVYRRYYNGEKASRKTREAACRKAVDSLRFKLGELGLTIDKRIWRLVELPE